MNQIIKTTKVILNRSKSTAERASLFHLMVDFYVSQSRKAAKDISISCKKGCSACCYQRIVITEDEAKLLAPFVKSEKRALLERQAEFKEDAVSWAKEYPNSKCVFLSEDGSCFVYENRPLVCRAYLWADDPKKCDVRSTERGTSFRSTIAYVIMETIFSMIKTGNMARMLLEQL